MPDIAGKTADGVLVAVLVEHPKHFRQPDFRPTGDTQYRHRALAKREYKRISVRINEWRKLQGDQQLEQQHLLQLFEKAGVVG